MSSLTQTLTERLTPLLSKRRPIDKEADFRRLWNEVTEPCASPFDMALSAGAVSDRMAWVFMSGYQAAIRATFDPKLTGLIPKGWTTFAVSESKKAPEQFPGVTHDGGDISHDEPDNKSLELSGYKTWIPGYPQLDSMIVKSDRGANALYVQIDAKASGLSFMPVDKPKALLELNQGIAHLDSVLVDNNQLLDRTLAKKFGVIEVWMILVAYLSALYAWCQAHSREAYCEEIAGILHDAERLSLDAFQIDGLLAVDQSVQGLMRKLKDDTEIQGSALFKERALIDMYSAGLARRTA